MEALRKVQRIQDEQRRKEARKLKKEAIFEKGNKPNTKNKPKPKTTRKPKTFKEKFNKRYKQPLDKSNTLNNMSKLSGISKDILQQVYDRGIGAYKTNLSSVRLKKDFSKDPDLRKGASMRLSKEQWAIARTYAFIEKTLNKKEPQNQDKDLMKEAREQLKKK